MIRLKGKAQIAGREDPEAQGLSRFPLLRYYLVTSIVVIAVITVAVAFLFVRKAESDFGKSSSTRGAVDAGHIAHLFFNEIWAQEQTQNPSVALKDVIEPLVLADFVRRSAFGLDIVKLNLIDLSGNVLWRSNPDTVEKRASERALYAAVIKKGTYSSEFHRSEAYTDANNAEIRLDVVRTIHPLRDATPFSHREGTIVGLVEMDRDVTAGLADVHRNTLLLVVFGSVGMGAILFILLFLIVFRADRAIVQGHRRIQRLSELNNRIIASTPTALAVLKGDRQVVTSVNRAFVDAFDISENAAVGRPIAGCLPLEGLEGIIQQAHLHAEPNGEQEMHYITPEGNKRWFMVSATSLRSGAETQKEAETLLVLTEVTEQKRHQEKLQETAHLASIGELAAGVAHELNNPLTVVAGFSEVLLETDLPKAAQEHVRRVHSEAKRAARIVQNLLSFARKHDPEKRYLDLTAVLEQALELKATNFKVNGINVVKRWSPELPHTMVDGHQMVQALLNILNNAERAMLKSHGGGEITCGATRSGSKLRISITDDGPGIPPENLRRIFDPFFTTSEVGEGTGLGLSICYGIVRQHDGEIWAESPPGKGSTFHIELPILAPDTGLESQVPDASVKP